MQMSQCCGEFRLGLLAAVFQQQTSHKTDDCAGFYMGALEDNHVEDMCENKEPQCKEPRSSSTLTKTIKAVKTLQGTPMPHKQ